MFGLIPQIRLNECSDNAILKAKSPLIVMRHLIGYEWGLKLCVAPRIYTAIVRPQLMYSFLVWWSKMAQATASSKLASLQQLGCMLITGAFRSTLTADRDFIKPAAFIHIRNIGGKAGCVIMVNTGGASLRWGTPKSSIKP